MTHFEHNLLNRIIAKNKPHRQALSSRFPSLARPILMARRMVKKSLDSLSYKLASTKQTSEFKHIAARHQSVLIRTLGDSDLRLQQQKVTNLRLAAEELNGLVIQPGETFSLWKILGQPTTKKGYVNGMLLSNGKVIEGVGGGLCQMANFLTWIFLHTPVEITERWHHSLDVFPDSGRTIPFGSGATICYNMIDLKITNTSKYPLQLKLWLTDKYLKGQILSAEPIVEKYHVYEKAHCFSRYQNKFYRFNEIWRDKKINGETITQEKIFTNFAPVMYEISPEYIEQNNFSFYDFDETLANESLVIMPKLETELQTS